MMNLVENEKIKYYILSIGLTEKDAQNYIDNNYTLEQVIESIEEVNNNFDDFDFEDFEI